MEREHIVLKTKERKELEDLTRKGVHSVRLVNRARIILALDTSAGRKAQTQETIAQNVGVSRQTVNVAKRDFLAAGNVSGFFQRKKRETPPVPAKITGDVEAHIIALACGPVPKGRARWTLRLLAEKSVELKYIDAISHTAVGSLLKKRGLSLT
jgi:hypothetical protein